MDLQTLWFFLLGVLLIGYAILDGFDFGVGSLHLFIKGDENRRIFMNSIGPVWDGNEVWLVTAGGVLFAAFPNAYATVLSAAYVPFYTLLAALIFRAVALEFRSKEKYKLWRSFWDGAFCFSSVTAAVLFGVLLGNLVIGIPVGADYEFSGGLMDLLSPYALLVGLFTLTTFTMHGAIYLYLKTEDKVQETVRRWIMPSFFAFLAMYLITTIATLTVYPQMVQNFSDFWWAWVVAVLTFLAVLNIPRAMHKRLPGRAFISSCCTIAGLIFLFGIGTFPNLIVSSIDPAFNLTLYNASSSSSTLKIMLIITAIGLPFVLAYTTIIYWVFRGKVVLDETSY